MAVLTIGVTPEDKHNLPNQIAGSRFPAQFAGFDIPGHGRMGGAGDTLPVDGDTGWGKAALFLHTNGSGADDLVFENTGDTTSCTFVPVTSVAGGDFGATGLKADVIAESTSANGVAVDGVVLKDGAVDPTGDVTIDAAQKFAGAGSTIVGLMPAAAQQALSGAGAVTITQFYTAVTNTGTDALTLVDGAQIGQLKKVQMIVDPGTDSTLTPTSLGGGTTIVFADVGDYCVLMWDGTNWIALELGNDADGATAPVLA